MSKRSYEELVGIFSNKGLASIMEAQGAKVSMSPRCQRSSRNKVPTKPQPQKKQ